jgi:hypothetical protein
MGDFLEYIIWLSLDNSKTIPIIWLSLDISKNNLKDNYFIFKPNYLLLLLLLLF